MLKLNEKDSFKQEARHRDFIKTMFEYIYDDCPSGFLQCASMYFKAILQEDEDEIYSAFTLEINNGYVKESILQYLNVHIRSLANNYERFGCPSILSKHKSWSAIKNNINGHFTKRVLHQEIKSRNIKFEDINEF